MINILHSTIPQFIDLTDQLIYNRFAAKWIDMKKIFSIHDYMSTGFDAEYLIQTSRDLCSPLKSYKGLITWFISYREIHIDTDRDRIGVI